MTQMRFEQQVRQQLSLTPKQQQSVKLLQMSTLEFSQEINAAIASNPFLESPEDTFMNGDGVPEEESQASAPNHTDIEPGSDINPESHPSQDEETAGPAIHAETAIETPHSYSGDYPSRKHTDQAGGDIGQWAQSATSFQDSLLADLCAYSLSERDRMLAEHIIEAIDEDGYLRVPFNDLSDTSQLAPAPNNEEWEIALRLVQQLATPGLAARDLKECMMLQLHALPATTAHVQPAMEIVSDHLDMLARGDYAGLARNLRCANEDIQAACTLIRSLEPHPGRSHGQVDPSTYIIPDVIVRKVNTLWVAVANEDAIPQARLNHTYAHMFRNMRYKDRALMAKELQEARWLLRSLEQRSSTIQRVAQAIVARQQTFFDYGDIALRPLMLSEIADELGIHESTVSRATSHKYLASPRGTLEFKHFFSRELPTRSGGTCSAGAVRALIQEMIAGEDPKSPLSDVVLAHKLEGEGIVVARRTVSKYRAQIKIPPAELRRAL